MNIVCNTALAEATGGVCLLLPYPAGMDQLVSVMCALSYLPQDSAELASEQIAKTFREGQKVRVLPDGSVYRVAGTLTVGAEQGYWLQFLDAKRGSGNGKFAVWGKDLKRLEPTERSRPLGADKKLWSSPQPTSIDRLCGTDTLGNHAVLSNRVMLLGSRTDLQSFLEETRLLPEDPALAQHARPLGDEFPWGSISDDGSVYIEYPRSTPGEPLIAATRNFAAARKASELAATGSKLFVSRWLEGCLQNFETLSRIADRQRAVLLVDASARDRVGPLKKDGWTVWELSPAEVLGDDPIEHTGLPCIDRNASAAQRERHLEIKFQSVSNEDLRQCYDRLRLLGDVISSVDHDETEILDDRVEDQVSRLWGLFLEAAGWLVAPSMEQHEALRAKLDEVRGTTEALRAVATCEILAPMRESVGALLAFVTAHAPGTTTEKGDALLSAVESGKPGTVVCGSAQDRDQARAALDGFLDAHRIVSASEVQPLHETETIVACSMMARKAFARFLDPCPATTVVLVGYDFEQEVYEGRLKRRKALQTRLSPAFSIKERLAGVPLKEATPEAHVISTEPREIPGIERVAAATRKPKFELPHAVSTESDQTREARLCKFAGCSWAIFTPNHSISVLGQEGVSALARKTVDDLQSGDRLLLREAGDKDVIRLLAEDIVGPGQYSDLWEKCQRWKAALRIISPNPTGLWQKLSWLGLHRDPLTIRHWLLDEGVIGPRLRDDIAIIAEAAGERPEDKKWDDCWDAIIRLRSLHMQAGMRLTKALEEECRDLLFVDLEHEQAVELSLGLLWLVKVHEVHGLAHWPANLVNHLHWGREDWREEMLQNALVQEV